MLQQIWDWILQTAALFVTPDWGALIALLPVGIFALVVVWLVVTIRRFRSAAPARRGKGRVTPKTPAGIHMPGPSFAPIFGAIGTALLMFGFVYGGLFLVLGAIGLALTLLYWLAEGIRNYDHDHGTTVPQLPAVVSDGPPPGVHMPGPSFRPILGALGTALLLFGLVYGGWLLAAGVIALVLTLLGWGRDAMHEYDRTVDADRTGHLANGPFPRVPAALLWVIAVVFVGGTLLQTGVLPPKPANGAGGAAGSPGPSAGASAPAPSSGGGGTPSGPPQPTGDVTIHAQNIAFLDTAVTGPAGKPFTIVFVNEDPSTSHNVDIKDASGKQVFQGEIFPGVATKVYDVPALPAGSYPFVCTVHASMTGTLTIQ